MTNLNDAIRADLGQPRNTGKLALALAVFVGAIVAANYMTSHYGQVGVGFGLLVTAGTFAAGFALLARDFIQQYGNVRIALIAIVVGGLLSWVLSDGRIALASGIAFAVAELVDLFVFTPLRARREFFTAALVSNIVAAPVDTVLFLWIAGFPVTGEAIAGQFLGKIVWATLIPLTVYVVARALLREPSRR